VEGETFFFQGTSLLGVSGPGIPAFHDGNFPGADVFTVPGLEAGANGGEISCVYIPVEVSLPPGWQAIPVHQAATEGSGLNADMLRAFHIAQWRQDSKYCGSCGTKNIEAEAETARLCPACGRMEFPRIAPAVITIITNNEDKVLLAHNKKFAPGVYSLVAGFVEAGENLEAAAAREIREETGIEVCDIRYVVSQPWPFPHSLMAGFTARYASGTVKPDGVEIEDAQWFDKDHLPKLPGPGSVSRLLIDRWLEGSHSRFRIGRLQPRTRRHRNSRKANGSAGRRGSRRQYADHAGKRNGGGEDLLHAGRNRAKCRKRALQRYRQASYNNGQAHPESHSH
jgi:NAD+ diphosphatase